MNEDGFITNGELFSVRTLTWGIFGLIVTLGVENDGW